MHLSFFFSLSLSFSLCLFVCCCFSWLRCWLDCTLGSFKHHVCRHNAGFSHQVHIPCFVLFPKEPVIDGKKSQRIRQWLFKHRFLRQQRAQCLPPHNKTGPLNGHTPKHYWQLACFYALKAMELFEMYNTENSFSSSSSSFLFREVIQSEHGLSEG